MHPTTTAPLLQKLRIQQRQPSGFTRGRSPKASHPMPAVAIVEKMTDTDPGCVAWLFSGVVVHLSTREAGTSSRLPEPRGNTMMSNTFVVLST